jgi:cytochrome bd-type quinol oxidase subunit 1
MMPAADAEMLARVQSAFAVGCHFVIAALSVGPALMVVVSVLAARLGWSAAKMGRQPRVAQGLPRTSQGISPGGRPATG